MADTAAPLRYRCPGCGRMLGVARRMVGRQTKCPGCGTATRVPATDVLPSIAVPIAVPPLMTDDGGGFSLRARKAEIDELDLTPMVDVTFLLLIFFMITASFNMQKTLEVPAPDPDTAGASPVPLEQIEENSVVVRVEAGDRFFVDELAVGGPDDLAPAIASAMADGGRTELVIEAADAARHEAVVAVYDAGNEAGMQKVRLATTVP